MKIDPTPDSQPPETGEGAEQDRDPTTRPETGHSTTTNVSAREKSIVPINVGIQNNKFAGVTRNRDIHVTLYHEKQRIEVSAGEVFSLPIEVTNQGDSNRHIRLSVQGIAKRAGLDVCAVEPSQLEVPDHASAMLTIRATDTLPWAGEWRISILARDTENPGDDWESNPKTLAVAARPRIRLSENGPVEATSAGRYSKAVIVENCGNSRVRGKVSPVPADTGQEVAAGADATKLPSSKVGTSDEIELSPGESRETSIMVSLPEQALGDREWNFRLGFYSSQELDISFRALDARARQVGLLTELNEWLRTALVEILSAVERIVQWSAKTATVPRWTLAYLVPIALIVCGVIGAQTTGSSTNASTPSARQSAPSNTPLTARSGAPSTLEIHAGDLKCDGRWIVLLARSSDHADIAYFFGRANSARTLGEIEYTQISTDCAGLRTGEWVLFAGTFGSEAESELAVTRSGVDGTVLQLR